MTVAELLSRVSSAELTEWMAFYRLEPWGSEVEDWRFGMVASVIANVNRDPKQRRKPFDPPDFMPKRGPSQEKREQSPDEIMRVLQMWQTAFDAKPT